MNILIYGILAAAGLACAAALGMALALGWAADGDDTEAEADAATR